MLLVICLFYTFYTSPVLVRSNGVSLDEIPGLGRAGCVFQVYDPIQCNFSMTTLVLIG